MTTKICNYVFDGRPSFNIGYNRRCVDFVVPSDTTNEVIEELKEADSLELINSKGVTEGTYRLTDWVGVERVFSNGHSGIAIRWNTVTLDEVDELKDQISSLQAENERLLEENSTLTDALLELAELVGGEETEVPE